MYREIYFHFVGPSAIPLEQYPFKKYIPRIFRDYIQGVVDVKGDGNCGFRAISSFVFGNEENWRAVREAAASELKTERELYENYYIDVDESINRIEWFEENCPRRNWMISPNDLYPIATYFNLIIISISFGTNESSTASCCTIFPSYVSDRGVSARSQVICIALIPQIDHYVRLNVSETCPMPPFPYRWLRFRKDCVKNWERPFKDRLDKWQSLAS